MDPQFQTSFIPKKPVDAGIKMVEAKEPTSVLAVFTWIVIVATIVVSGFLFVYERQLKSQIIQDETSIVSAKGAFQPDTIQQLVNISNQISYTKSLLNSHVLVSRVLDTLQTLTVKKIYFVDFSYTDLDGEPSIAMQGESQSYNALAQQYNIFSASGSILNPAFSNFDLAQDGNISFKFTADVDPGLISYPKAVESSANQ